MHTCYILYTQALHSKRTIQPCIQHGRHHDDGNGSKGQAEAYLDGRVGGGGVLQVQVVADDEGQQVGGHDGGRVEPVLNPAVAALVHPAEQGTVTRSEGGKAGREDGRREG